MNFPVFDLHCDTALGLLGREFVPSTKLKSNDLHIDLDRASKLPGYCQFFACFTTPMEKLPPNITVEDVFERELNVILNEVGHNSDRIRQAFTPEDIKENLNRILAENTGKPLDVIKQDTERDNFMTAQQALEYGLIDKVIAHR